jgi:hypothetical protein
MPLFIFCAKILFFCIHFFTDCCIAKTLQNFSFARFFQNNMMIFSKSSRGEACPAATEYQGVYDTAHQCAF